MPSTTMPGGPGAAPWRGRAALGSPGRLTVYAAIAGLSFVCFIAGRFVEGPVSIAFTTVGVGACGWSWLLTRALFDPEKRDARWARIVGSLVVGAGALSVLAPAGGALSRLADGVYALSGSAALLLTFVEPFHGYRRDLPVSEKRFRLAFLTLYTVLIAVSILGLGMSESGAVNARWNDLIKSGCAVLGLCGGAAAVAFRVRRPLAARGTSRRAATQDDAKLAERLLHLLREEEIHADPDLRIGDVAVRLRQPEYRVSQCISTALGFANFNRLINHYRIESAKRALADPQDRRSILQIAFDCGFGSVGPFNRAFKDEVGLTPRAFRLAGRRGGDA